MPSFKSGELVKKVRKRKKWQQERLSFDTGCATNTLSRIENSHQKPTEEIFHSLMYTLKVPVKQFFYTYLEDQTMDIYLLCEQLNNCLEQEEIDQTIKETAEKLINELEQEKKFAEGVNLQFILSCKAQLYQKLGYEAANILPLIKAGMAITFPEFDEEDLDNKIFILEEIKLLHTKALVYSQTGDHKKAVKLLYGIKEGLIKLPEDDYEKEKKLPEILLTLSQLLIKISDFREGLKTCELGYKIALEGNRGRTIPRLLYNKALCLFHLKRNSECQSLIYQAYFGFSIFMMRKQAKQVYENAKDLFGITIETYGTHRIIDEYEPQYTPIKRGEPISFEHIGMLLAKLRVNNRMSSEELCEGICSVPTLNRIENGVRQTNVYILEALFQRLGRDINLYMNTFLSAADFEEKQIRNGIITHLVLCQYDEAKELLAKLEKSKRYQSGINLQFIKNTKAILISSQEGYSENFLKALIEGIKITRPDFDELEIGQYHLTYYEILFINNIASYYCENDKVLHGLKIYERLIESINKNCVDELEKIRTYTMILYNYSKHLGLTGRYKEAIDIIAEGEKLELRHGRIRHLDGFAINKACSYLEMGYKEESIPYFAQSYYCHAMLGEKATQENIWNYAKEKVGIAFVKV